MDNQNVYLEPGDIIDSNNASVIGFMKSTIGSLTLSPTEKAVKLYLRVRDEIRYNPYLPFFLPEHYRSSGVIKAKESFCIGKAGLLCAVARAAGIPARVGFATVRNHLATRQFLESMGSDVISWHGYSELWLEGKWVKCTPAFNAELCALHRVPPLEFDGVRDSIFHEYNSDKARYMEYLAYHGEFHDIPVDLIVSSWEHDYGRERVEMWKTESLKRLGRDFMKEDVV